MIRLLTKDLNDSKSCFTRRSSCSFSAARCRCLEVPSTISSTFCQISFKRVFVPSANFSISSTFTVMLWIWSVFLLLSSRPNFSFFFLGSSFSFCLDSPLNERFHYICYNANRLKNFIKICSIICIKRSEIKITFQVLLPLLTFKRRRID